MSSPKEIAEKVIKGKEYITSIDTEPRILARAYLELEKEIIKLKKSREVLRVSLKFYSAHELKFAKYGMSIGESLVKEFYSNGSNARQALMMDDEIMGNSFKIDSNIFKAPVDGWYSFSGGMFKLSANQPTELINGEYGIEPKEYLEKIAYKKED